MEGVPAKMSWAEKSMVRKQCWQHCSRSVLVAALCLIGLSPYHVSSGLSSPLCTATGTRLFLVRHGQRIDYEIKEWISDANKNGLNPWDPYLTEVGHHQAIKLGMYLQERGGVSRVFSSPFLRCLQFAHGVTKPIDNMYVKINCETIDDKYATLVDPNFPETLEQFRHRCRRIIRMICERHRGETILIVTHATMVEAITQELVPTTTQVPDVDFGALTELEQDSEGNAWRVVTLCDSSYLERDYGEVEELILREA